MEGHEAVSSKPKVGSARAVMFFMEQKIEKDGKLMWMWNESIKFCLPQESESIAEAVVVLTRHHLQFVKTSQTDYEEYFCNMEWNIPLVSIYRHICLLYGHFLYSTWLKLRRLQTWRREVSWCKFFKHQFIIMGVVKADTFIFWQSTSTTTLVIICCWTCQFIS